MTVINPRRADGIIYAVRARRTQGLNGPGIRRARIEAVYYLSRGNGERKSCVKRVANTFPSLPSYIFILRCVHTSDYGLL